MGYGVDFSKKEFTEEEQEKIIFETTIIIEDGKEDQEEIGTAYYNRGLIYYGKDEEEKALPDFAKAIELMPNYAPAYFMKASCHHMFFEEEEALADAQKALQLDETKTKYKDFVLELIKLIEEKEQKIEKMTENLLKGYNTFQEKLNKIKQ